MDSKTLAEVPSGTIDMVFVNDEPVIQFNCACEDALPYCNAVCCRCRPRSNVALEKDEFQRFSQSSVPHHSMPGVRILAYENGHCIHLKDNNDCGVQEIKPSICKRWHCSPGGKGEGVELRDGGWKLKIFNGNLQELDEPRV